jgi:hypothetical protein
VSYEKIGYHRNCSRRDAGDVKCICQGCGWHDQVHRHKGLNNGQKVRPPEGIEAESLKVGEHVAITYTTNASGKSIVSGIRPIK